MNHEIRYGTLGDLDRSNLYRGGAVFADVRGGLVDKSMKGITWNK